MLKDSNSPSWGEDINNVCNHWVIVLYSLNPYDIAYQL